MAEYHTSLQELEELVGSRIELIRRGSRHVGIDKGINYKITDLLREGSLPSRAEEYCRRLKIIRQQLVGYVMLDIDRLISQQKSLLPDTKPNTGKPRSPKLSPPPSPPPPLVRPQRRAKNPVNMGAAPHVTWRDQQPNPASISHLPNTAVPQAAPVPHVPGAWPSTTHHRSQPTHPAHQEPASLREPPAHYINVLSIDSKERRYRNQNRYRPTRIKVAGVHQVDNYFGVTHPLLTDPSKIGVFMWSPNSPLVIVQSNDYVPYTAGDVLHIRAYSSQDAQRFAQYTLQWYANTGTRIFQVSRSVKALVNVSKANIWYSPQLEDAFGRRIV
ncbi:MAG: hypothetical protein Q9225_003014 [Loekoesia sp. 1 TL-2023]